MGKNKLRKRDEIPAQYKWNMQDMFATDELWEEEADKVVELAKGLEKYNGHLSDSAETLLEFAKKLDELNYHAGFVCSYILEKDIEKAMSVGSEIAAETLMHYGGF